MTKINRRSFLNAAAAAATTATATTAFVGSSEIRRLWTGAEWTGGPVYFGDMHCVLFSDVPNNRIMRYGEVTGQTTVFRYPSNEANGNTRDRQGRLVTCEQPSRPDASAGI